MQPQPKGDTMRTSDNHITERQLAYIRALLDERVVTCEQTPEQLAEQASHLTRKQASAWIERLRELPHKEGGYQPAPDVPAGCYALAFEGGTQFFKVDRPTQGKWEGRTFLCRMHGENHEPMRNRAERTALLELIAADVEGAARRYGHYARECGFCRHSLTDPFSRFFGVGPVCRKRHGMPRSAAAYRSRSELAERELDAWLAEDATQVAA